jgi:SAM-dependent methyltransferase
MSEKKTREPQYQFQVALDEERPRTTFGMMINAAWDQDPRRLLFLLARYKFVAKMLKGKKKVLEVGCGDAFGTRMVQQDVGAVTAVDFDPLFVKDANDRMSPAWKFECKVHDMLAGPVQGTFDAAYSLDVLEHIMRADEARFIENTIKSLSSSGVLIVGSPSLQSQAYASPASKEGHVNCKDGEELRALMLKYFDNVFLFSMNDEVVHTGFHPMAHYLIALCCGKRAGSEATGKKGADR